MDGHSVQLVPRRGPWRQALARFRRRPLGMAAAAVFGAFVLVAVFAGSIAPYAAGRTFLQFMQRPQRPLVAHHLLGTDVLGHDFLTELVFAVHQTVLSGLVCAAGATAVGVTVGALAGYYGGWYDAVVTWTTGVAVSIPAMAILVVVLIWSNVAVTPLNDGLWLTAVLWTGVARVVRASVLSLRTRAYVDAAQASSASDLRILLRHLLPNAAGPIIVAATSLVAQAVVIVATVNYLGFSFDTAEKPTLGGLVSSATASTSGALVTGPTSLGALWWLYVFPAAALVVFLMSVAFLGDALDEALNPSARTR
jgi:ABC-type dipeptide/oligopeptide/nickel transport system permease subunit